MTASLRLLLDARLSRRRIGRPLARRGHDVLALDADPTLAPLPDDEVLELAASEHGILVTHDVRDFVPLIRAAADAGRSHTGCVVSLLPTRAYGRLLRGLDRLSLEHPTQRDWFDRVEFLA